MNRPNHFCPGCGATQTSVPRYPWHFCNDCRRNAVDGDGVRLEFSNASGSGGLAWRRQGDAEWHQDDLRVLCRISGRPVIVHEARFGGVVAEPIQDGTPTWMGESTTCDLRRPSKS